MAKQNYNLKGAVKNSNQQALSDLRIEAWDNDMLIKEPLGSAITDASGNFEIKIDEKYYTEIITKRKPDVYFQIFKEKELITNTIKDVIWNVKSAKDIISISVDFDAPVEEDKENVKDELNPTLIKKLDILNSATGDTKIKESIEDAFKNAKGDWNLAKEDLKKTGTSEALLRKLDFIYALADVTNDKPDLVTALTELPGVNNTRELALTHSTSSLTSILEKKQLNGYDFTDDPKIKAKLAANSITKNLFTKETSAVIQRAAKQGELPLGELGNEVSKFFENQPEFNISTTTILKAITHPEAFKDIKEEKKEEVTKQLKTLQRVYSVSPNFETMSALLESKLSSAMQIADISEHNFVSAFSSKIGQEEAKVTYQLASNKKIATEHLLMQLTETIKGTGIAAIDGTAKVNDRLDILKGKAGNKEIAINWETLFDSPDLCECNHCNSVYSPAAYFVELLQYLRNNNLDTDATDGQAIRTDPNDIRGTVLEKFFQRRPDLGCLELTCKNANTILPYIDLVNEVMESYIVHIETSVPLHANPGNRLHAQYKIDPWNIYDETSAELLAQPQHTNLHAYQILKAAVYPFQLPYHQPMDVIRSFLQFLGTSRQELMNVFRCGSALPFDNLELPEGESGPAADTYDASSIENENRQALDRAIAAESLGITQEEYVILTKQGFWARNYFDAKYHSSVSEEDYQRMIGLKAVWEYYGYPSKNDMLSGLPLVKDHFLKRTGLEYNDLVELLKAEFINPNFPSGNSLRIMESLPFNYGYWKTLIHHDQDEPYRDLLKLLDVIQPSGNACPPTVLPKAVTKTELKEWAMYEFEKIGSMIVLDSFEEEVIVLTHQQTHQKSDTCDLNHVRLIHLDGSPVSVFEYDKIHRFIRLWKKMGCTINELDRSIIGLARNEDGTYDITREYLQQLATVKQLQSDTGLELTKLLSFWTRIDTHGDHSLYARLFLRPNLRSLDPVFQQDEEGNYFNAIPPQLPPKIKEHFPVLMAAFHLKSDDIDSIMDCAGIQYDGLLNLENVSSIYRHSLLMRLINVKSEQLKSITEIFGDPFHDAATTAGFLNNWGKMKDSGFGFSQFQYLVALSTDPQHPLTPGDEFISQLAKLLHDGLHIISKAHPNLGDHENATAELVREKLALWFKPDISEQIIKVLDGTTVYIMETGSSYLMNQTHFTPELNAKFKYDLTTHQLKVTGILTPEERSIIPVASTTTEWANEFVHLNALAISKYPRELNEVFTDTDTSRDILLGEDILSDELETVTGKRNHLMRSFLPFLRAQLNKKFLIETISVQAGLGKEITEYLISELLHSALTLEGHTTEPLLIEIFEKYNQQSSGLKAAYIKLQKAAIVVNTFRLTVGESKYFHLHPEDFGRINFDNFHLDHLLRLEAYTRLRNSLPNTETDLISFFEWVNSASASGDYLPQQIAALTQWKIAEIKNICYETHFNVLHPRYFKNEEHLLKLQSAISVAAKLNVGIDKLFNWGRPVSAFDSSQMIATDIRMTLQAKYRESDWEQVVKPLHDQLRENQRNALISYLLQQQPLQDWGVTDANSLFEFFLIDVQMDACMPTSRIKQAINSVQLYVQRCFLDLERKYGVASNILDRPRWKWMQRNVLWEANRKVFLYPENWIEEELRDDKSPFFKELESELLQKDINQQTVTDALKSYLYKLDEVANMQVVGLFVEQTAFRDRPIIHVFSRTRNAPYFFYYRSYDDKRNWTPWEKVQVDIPSYDIEENNTITANGCYLIPVVLGKRLLIFFPQFQKKTKAREHTTRDGDHQHSSNIREMAESRPSESQPIEYWEIKMGWSEYRNGKWTQKQLSKESVLDMPEMTSGITQLIVLARQLSERALDAKQAAQNAQAAATDAVQKINETIDAVNTAFDAFTAWRITGFTDFIITGPIFLTTHTIAESTINVARAFTASVEDMTNVAKSKMGFAISKSHELISQADDIDRNLLNQLTTCITDAENEINLAVTAHNAKTYFDSRFAFDYLADRPTGLFDFARSDAGKAEREVEALRIRSDALNAAALAILSTIEPVLSAVSQYQFVPIIKPRERKVLIDLYKVSLTETGWEPVINQAFEFSRNGLNLGNCVRITNTNDLPDHFHDKGIWEDTIPVTITKALQTSETGQVNTDKEPSFIVSPLKPLLYFYNYYQPFFHPYSHDFLSGIHEENLEDFFEHRNIPAIISDGKFEAFGKVGSENYNELKTPYSIYNWELFFHAPVLLADKLSKSQQFEEAMRWFHFVFNPMVHDPSETDALLPTRAWRFLPFKDRDSNISVEELLNGLQPNVADPKITAWRDHPYAPHVIARDRPAAYMKWVVMKYLDNLISWGDYLFRQHTIESINQATQLYILAGHILGPRPDTIPKRGKIKPETYNSLLGRWDAFSNAMVELELMLPFSNQGIAQPDKTNSKAPYTNLFGTVSSLYFCIPNNPKLAAYWDTIEDRLYKIRHCENIEGVLSLPPLWDAAIDPALLVQATALGADISVVLNELESPMPNYRFYYLLQKSLELCNELKSMGASLLSVLEKKDSEALSRMRASHERKLHDLVMEVKKLQIREAEVALEGLIQNRKSPEYRLKHYLQLIGEDLDNVPTPNVDFTEIPNHLDPPVELSGLKLSAYEKEEMVKANEAAIWQLEIGIIETIAGIVSLIPNFATDVKPFGIGVGMTFGGANIAEAIKAHSRGLQVYASHLSYQSSSAQRKGGFQRALQDRIFQTNLAGYEIKQIDRQVASQKIRLQIAGQEIANQQQQIDNSLEVEAFLKDKYTNAELYFWMENSIKSLHHQVYTLAYDLAKKAERTFRFERGILSSNFIQFGNWDASHDGIHSGERLYVGLKQMEAAYQNGSGFDYEITKHISLQLVDPLALIQLRATSKCEFALHEVLFDLDFPGHYKRRIKSISISIPCIAGPYTGINASLRLIANKFRNTPMGGGDYQEIIGESETRFSSFTIPMNAIATSTAQNDSGTFDLNFKDERYLPFEGAGVISKWRLELPEQFKQFDYNTISDVVIHMKYTASEGGESLKSRALGAVQNQLTNLEQALSETGFHVAINLKHELPNEWHLLKRNNTINLTIDKARLPYMVHAISTVTIANVMFVAKVEGTLSSLSINVNRHTTIMDRNNELQLYIGVNSGIALGTSFTLSTLSTEDADKLDELIMIIKFNL